MPRTDQTAERVRQKYGVRHWHQLLAVSFLPVKSRSGTLARTGRRSDLRNRTT